MSAKLQQRAEAAKKQVRIGVGWQRTLYIRDVYIVVFVGLAREGMKQME